MSLIDRLREEQQGATIVLVALSMVVLMGFAAVAIDVAHSHDQRSEDQAAVDTGGVASGLEVSFKTQGPAIADATTEAMRITYNSVDPDMTFAEWQTAWGTCTDPTRPGIYTLNGTSDCVSFTSNLSKIRVKLPDVDVETTFGAVLGRSSIQTNAFVEIEALNSGGVGAILPFGLPGQAGGDIEICLKSGPQPKLPPCDGPAQGNFGFLDFTRFGDPTLGTTQQCGFNPKPKIVAENIAHGVDHGLDTATNINDLRSDIALCGTNFTGAPTGTSTSTGNMAKTIEDGFIGGINGYTARLARLGSGPPFQTRVVHTKTVDDTPLWAFLNTTGQTLCETVAIAGSDLMVNSKAEMILCLDAWTTDDGLIFNNALDDSPRMAWVPLLWQNAFPKGNKDVTYRAFHPVYVQTLYAKCTGGGAGASCQDVWEAGEGSPITSGKDFIATSALQFQEGMLPKVILDGIPGNPGQFLYVIIR